MSTTPHAAAAGAARQRLAASLGALQQDPNVPPAILEIISAKDQMGWRGGRPIPTEPIFSAWQG
jgi:hypothetical protein